MRSFEEDLRERLDNPEFKREWESGREEYERRKKDILDKIGGIVITREGLDKFRI